MSSSSCRITNGDPSESSSTTASAEIVQDIIEDVSGDDNSTGNAQTNNKDDGQTNADDDNGQQSKLVEFHVKTTLTPRWVGKIFVSYSLWPLDVTRWIYLITKNLLFHNPKPTILKSNQIPPL